MTSNTKQFIVQSERDDYRAGNQTSVKQSWRAEWHRDRTPRWGCDRRSFRSHCSRDNRVFNRMIQEAFSFLQSNDKDFAISNTNKKTIQILNIKMVLCEFHQENISHLYCIYFSTLNFFHLIPSCGSIKQFG